jgi:hypothetical protein
MLIECGSWDAFGHLRIPHQREVTVVQDQPLPVQARVVVGRLRISAGRAAGFLAVAVLTVRNLANGRLGLKLCAIHLDETAAFARGSTSQE